MTRRMALAVLWRLPALAVAAVWGFSAVSKIGWPAGDDSWLAEFPGSLVWTAVLLEAVVAFLILSGRIRAGLSLGFLLLLGFSVALIFHPPTPGQECGCAGSVVSSTSPSDIAAHLFAFTCAHLLAGVMGMRAAPSPYDDAVPSGSHA